MRTRQGFGGDTPAAVVTCEGRRKAALAPSEQSMRQRVLVPDALHASSSPGEGTKS